MVCSLLHFLWIKRTTAPLINASKFACPSSTFKQHKKGSRSENIDSNHFAKLLSSSLTNQHNKTNIKGLLTDRTNMLFILVHSGLRFLKSNSRLQK